MARIDIKLTDEEKEILREIAKKDGRSITKEIIQLAKERYEEIRNEKN